MKTAQCFGFYSSFSAACKECVVSADCKKELAEKNLVMFTEYIKMKAEFERVTNNVRR